MTQYEFTYNLPAKNQVNENNCTDVPVLVHLFDDTEIVELRCLLSAIPLIKSLHDFEFDVRKIAREKYNNEIKSNREMLFGETVPEQLLTNNEG